MNFSFLVIAFFFWDSNPGRPPPTQRVPRWRIGERPSDMGVRGCRRMPPWTNWRLLQQGVVGWTGGAVASIKYHKNPTTKWTRRDKAPQNLYPCCSAGSPPLPDGRAATSGNGTSRKNYHLAESNGKLLRVSCLEINDSYSKK